MERTPTGYEPKKLLSYFIEQAATQDFEVEANYNKFEENEFEENYNKPLYLLCKESIVK